MSGLGSESLTMTILNGDPLAEDGGKRLPTMLCGLSYHGPCGRHAQRRHLPRRNKLERGLEDRDLV